MIKAFILFSTLAFTAVAAQPVRLHIAGGFSNYNGDIQQKPFTLEQAKTAFGAGATFHITDKLALRADYTFAHLFANDKFNKKEALRARNLNFYTYIQELSLMGEYEIFNLNRYKISPYIFAGVGVFKFSPYTYDNQGKKNYLVGLSTEGQGVVPGRPGYKTTQVSFPVGGGIKYALSDEIRLGFELGFRILSTDYLDDVSTTYVDRDVLLAAKGAKAVELAFRGGELKTNPQQYPPGGSVRGNRNANDSYYFGLFRVEFKMNWFEKEGGSDKKLRCPVKL